MDWFNRNKDIQAMVNMSNQKPHLTLYGRWSCPYCVRVYRIITSLGLEERIENRKTTIGSKWRRDLKSRTGKTQVPCLFIDGQAMFESLDIIAWLQENESRIKPPS